MARLDQITGEEFVGYTFRGPPERRWRLWFLERHLDQLFHHDGWAITGEATGVWTVQKTLMGADRLDYVQLGPCVRYAHDGPTPWEAVWRLTDLTIDGVRTFGYDDTWRLGVWPD